MKLSPTDKIYQYIANHLPKRLIWYCLIRGWALHQALTNTRKLPSQVLVVDMIKKLDQNLKEDL